jgi:hypothetical protein
MRNISNELNWRMTLRLFLYIPFDSSHNGTEYCSLRVVTY